MPRRWNASIREKKWEKNTDVFSLAVSRSCKSPGMSCYRRSKRLRGHLAALEKISRKLLAPFTSCFPSSNLASKISCEPPLKQWTKKCGVKWDFIAPCIFPKYIYTLSGDSAWNFNAESGWYKRQSGDPSGMDGNCWTHSVLSVFEKIELVLSIL